MRLPTLIILILSGTVLNGQGLFESYSPEKDKSLFNLSGFIRSAHYLGKGDQTDIHFPSSFSDISLNLKIGDGYHFSAYSDLRYRYGSEFDTRIGNVDLREAWVGIYSSRIGFEAGKKIVKWGRTDIFNPLGAVTPQNDIIRSPDYADRDLPNMIVSGYLRPSDRISFTILMFPQYQPSVLPFTVMELPDYVEFINYIDNDALTTGLGYGIRNDYQFNSFDASLYWFDGYNKLPGIELGMLRIPDGSSTTPIISIEEHPYKMRMVGVDFEAVKGDFGLRGAFTWTKPYSGSMQEEHLPFPEFNWVATLNYSPGDLIFTIEYAGKSLIDWKKLETGSSFPDEENLNQLLLLPPEIARQYVDQQVNSFNRLYGYQVEKLYNMVGLNFTTSGERGHFQPDLSFIYNITTGEYLVMPVVIFKPIDRVTAKLGLEYWYGKEGSIYNYLIDPLNSIWFGVRVDF